MPIYILSYLTASTLLFVLGCTDQPNSPSIHLLSPDFAIQTVNEVPAEILQVDSDCDKHLEQALCISTNSELGLDTSCSRELVTAEQIASIKNIKNLLPTFHQKVFCNINQLQIQERIFSIGYVAIIRGQDYSNQGTVMGFRSEVLTEKGNNDLYSWKEQLNFGISSPKDVERIPRPSGPFVEEKVSEGYPPHFATILHEINHLIDSLNDAHEIDYSNCTKTDIKYIERCFIPKESYARFAWGIRIPVIMTYRSAENPESPDLDNIPYPKPSWTLKFPLVGSLCFYECSVTVSPLKIEEVYSELSKTDFVTSYATQSEREDFAEISVFYTLEQAQIPFSYKILGPDKVYFDGGKHYQSSTLDKKRAWLKDFFSKDLKYRFDANPAATPAPR